MVTRKATLAGAVALSAGVLAAAGCGGGGGTSDQQALTNWADSVCQAVVTWHQDLKGIPADLPKRNGELPKNAGEQAAREIQQATNQMVNSLQRLQPPKGNDAKAAQDALNKLSGQLRDDKNAIQKTMRGVSNASELVAALPSLRATLATAKTQIAATVTTLKGLNVKGDVVKAFAAAPACESLK